MGGGRRRRTQRKMKGGNFYGPGRAIAPGVLEWSAVENNAANPLTGAPIVDGNEMAAVKLVGGRRRKSRRGSRRGGRKSKKASRRSRKMRGGASFVSIAPAGGSFTGEGSAGLPNLTRYSASVPPSGGPKQGPDGVMRV